jgi:hypothetical protein
MMNAIRYYPDKNLLAIIERDNKKYRLINLELDKCL